MGFRWSRVQIPPARPTRTVSARPPKMCPWDCSCAPLASHSYFASSTSMSRVASEAAVYFRGVVAGLQCVDLIATIRADPIARSAEFAAGAARTKPIRPSTGLPLRVTRPRVVYPSSNRRGVQGTRRNYITVCGCVLSLPELECSERNELSMPFQRHSAVLALPSL